MMTRTVKNVEGHDIEVVTLTDLLVSERALRKWVIGSFVTIVLTAASLGVLYGRMVSDISQIGQRVEEIRKEGSVPVQDLHTQLGVIDERQKTNTANIEKMTALLMKNQETLIRIEARLGAKK
jgi:hypothetical protein